MATVIPTVLSRYRRLPCGDGWARFTPGVTGSLRRRCRICKRRWRVTIRPSQVQATALVAEWEEEEE